MLKDVVLLVLTEGEFLKDSMMKACEILCPEKLFANESLSRNTIVDRDCQMATDVKRS